MVVRDEEIAKLKQWDNYFMGIARAVGQNSKCLSRHIGAILVKDKSIISTGYNGPPRGVPICSERNPNNENVCPRRLAGFKSGEGLHMCVSGHAERNCLINACRMGICVKDSILYCDCYVPCKDCLVEVINAGVKEIVCNTKGSNTANKGAYYDELSKYLLENSNVSIRMVELKTRHSVYHNLELSTSSATMD